MAIRGHLRFGDEIEYTGQDRTQSKQTFRNAPTSTYNRQRAEAVYDYIEKHPGLSKVEIAKGLKLRTGAIESILPTMEKQGMLLYQMDSKLYAFKRITR
jgi:hypothetical protein